MGIFASFFGLLILWPVLLIVAIMVKIKMPGGPALTFGRACSRSAIGKQACHCSRVLAAFWMDLEMIVATVLGKKIVFAGEEI